MKLYFPVPADAEGALLRSFLRRCAVSTELARAVKAQEEKLGGEGRVLIRPSGTEALIRVMVEAKTDEIARKVAEDLAELVKKL